MKTTMLFAVPALLALTACGEAGAPEATTETAVEAEAPADAAPINPDDETAEPAPPPAEAEEAPHDESVPHDH